MKTCGAAKAGLSKLQNNQIVKGAITDLDYQIQLDWFFSFMPCNINEKSECEK